MTGGFPAVPVIDQVTAVFEVPETEAVNGKESPARMLAVVGETETCTPAGGGGGWPVGVEVPAHPAINTAARMTPKWNGLRMFVRKHGDMDFSI
jgi:hypothetical protein